jgi:DHA1 family bicyclomycin/chloramphenicol resistance-like MFS transporter
MFLGMASHGINFPVTQSSAVSPFPQQAGTAAGLMGALFMVFAFLIGSLVGVSHNGTLIPMAIIALILGTLNFLSVRVLTVPSSHS